MKIDQLINQCKNYNPQYHKKGKLLFIPPIDKVLSGIYFEKVNDHFYLWLFAQPLVIPTDHYFFTFGNRLKDQKTNATLFELTEASLEKVKKIISDPENISRIKELSDINLFFEAYKSKIKDFPFLRDLAFISAYLNKADSEDYLNEFIKHAKLQIADGADYLIPEVERAEALLISSAKEKQDLFKTWMEGTLKALKFDVSKK